MSELEINIRKMVAEDLEQVYALEKASFSTPWSLDSFQFELKGNKASHLWVAEVRGDDFEKKVIGMIVVWLLLDEAHIATVAVEEDYRRRGIASQLICTALTDLGEKGAIGATLEVREGNKAAQELYRGFGFEFVGRRKGYYKDSGEDAILMTLHRLDIDRFTPIACRQALSSVNGG